MPSLWVEDADEAKISKWEHSIIALPFALRAAILAGTCSYNSPTGNEW
jgi:hypothetical protein